MRSSFSHSLSLFSLLSSLFYFITKIFGAKLNTKTASSLELQFQFIVIIMIIIVIIVSFLLCEFVCFNRRIHLDSSKCKQKCWMQKWDKECRTKQREANDKTREKIYIYKNHTVFFYNALHISIYTHMSVRMAWFQPHFS